MPLLNRTFFLCDAPLVARNLLSLLRPYADEADFYVSILPGERTCADTERKLTSRRKSK